MAIPEGFKQTVGFGKFELDLRTQELRKNGRKLTLQEQPFQILAALLERPGQLVTRDELTKRLWPSDTFVDFEHSLNKAVNRLREALDDSAEHPRLVETLPRRGYRWIGPVIRNGNDNVASEIRLVVPGAEHSSGMWTPSAESGRSRRLWLAIPAGCLIIALAAGFFFLHSRRAHPLTEKDSIIVADFVNTTG